MIRPEVVRLKTGLLTEDRVFCRDCGHWEHDPGSCDGLGHYFVNGLPLVTDCDCEVYGNGSAKGSKP